MPPCVYTPRTRLHEQVLPKASSAVPWGDLDRLYHSLWNMSKPILLETSPPEKDHSGALFKRFSQYGQVRCSYMRRVLCGADFAPCAGVAQHVCCPRRCAC